MEQEISKRKRRIGIIVNYLSLIFIIILIQAGKPYGLDTALLLTGALGALIVGLISFISVYWKTRLWRLVHTSFKELDERQIHVVYNSIRYSYGIFCILCLIIIYFNAIVEKTNIDISTAGGFLYLAHILPASIIAWTEKEVLIESGKS
ncbi:hypothetical protein ACFL6I_10395 [candidate division KSB1 bacterium]